MAISTVQAEFKCDIEKIWIMIICQDIGLVFFPPTEMW